MTTTTERTQFYVVQSETWSITVAWEDANEDPVNMAGYTVAMQLRQEHDDTTAAVSLTSSSGIAVTAASGLMEITIAKTTTDDLSGPYIFDLVATSPSGTATVLLRGTLNVLDDVTR